MHIQSRRITLFILICFNFFCLLKGLSVQAQGADSYARQQQVDQSFRERQFDLQTRQSLQIRQTDPGAVNRLQALQREQGLRQRELFEQQRQQAGAPTIGQTMAEQQRFEQERAAQTLDFELQSHTRMQPLTNTE